MGKNMELGVIILLSAAAVTLLYLFFYALFSAFAKSEIEHSREVKRRGQTFEIYASAESLEYYVRMAMAAEPKTKIIVNIERGGADSEEQEFIASRLARRAGNLKIRYIN